MYANVQSIRFSASIVKPGPYHNITTFFGAWPTVQGASLSIVAAFRLNHLLDALSSVELGRFSPELELIAMPAGLVIYDVDRPQLHAYFPIDALVSLQCVMRDGRCGETAMVGNEGVVGVSIFMGGDSTTGRAVVRASGRGYRVKALVLRREFDRSGSLMKLLLRYTQALLTQMSQTAVCNRHHSIDEQFCRGLLLSLDLMRVSEFSMTHELIANILGVRREGITESAGKLQNAGLIRYVRGRVSVTNRKGLEQRACECYRVIHGEYKRLLPHRTTTPMNGTLDIPSEEEMLRRPRSLFSPASIEQHRLS